MPLVKNAKANYEYNFKDFFEAGLALTGAETKAVKSGNASLQGSFVVLSQNGAPNLINCHIGAYKYASVAKYDPLRTRKVLLRKQEIQKLLGKEKGLVIVPLEIYQNPRGWIKLRLGLGRARKKVDKREYLKKKEQEKEIRLSI